MTYFSVVLYFGEKEEDTWAVGREGIAGGPFFFSRPPRTTSQPCNPPRAEARPDRRTKK